MFNDKLDRLINTGSFGNGQRVTPQILPQHTPIDLTALANPAKRAHDSIKGLIFNFEKNLSPDEEVGCRLVSFGNDSVYYIDDIDYCGTDIVIFYCTDSANNAQATLIQNVSQINVLLLKLPRKNQDAKAKRIGFATTEDTPTATDD